ncbi:cell wall hydrolase [Clostridium sediminicola]|uniref:cell wall hydrolase n=1 Tax=Clostridium sediminicola TaxID=3114879 RepID=UPI0031F25DFD
MKPKRFIVCIVTLSFLLILFSNTSKAVIMNDAETKNLYNDQSKSITVFSNTGSNVVLSNTDIDLMAKVVFAESNLEPYEGKVGVAAVILNRLRDNSFPNTIDGVIMQKWAFSCVKDGKISVSPNNACYRAVYDALRGNDPTNNAVFFYNPKISTSQWMFNVKKNNIKTIGQHVFFTAK